MVKLVGIAGSLRTESYSHQALAIAASKAQDLGAEVTVLDLRQMTLPFCHGGDYADHPDVAVLQQAVKAADGLILATPEYHGSVSGVLKNALDLMSFEQLDGKVVGTISVLGGQANSNALNDLRKIARWVHAWVIPEQVAIGQAWQAFDEQGKLVDAKLAERLDKLVESLVTHTQKLRPSSVDE
ncbi:NADPH-dependent FMN reductase [Halomicronema sp. CCY15110]|uniref:NADPH-dependent FMN reductase n=1 Tax=Halomicronema sp. CCY15110 TaxID=2767773 RepID=UPI0019529301|nr:NADPH-dependent FMN reductase [Halomicronema sp. CCY15110]